ncbi:UNVERIFIED_CONTAM: hypothetical protein HDU68_007840 [Siphonaria sp. JEL0065]|nr:hypothetical protein HDU68_007840 [Siphonaria sp. JEL0065]
MARNVMVQRLSQARPLPTAAICLAPETMLKTVIISSSTTTSVVDAFETDELWTDAPEDVLDYVNNFNKYNLHNFANHNKLHQFNHFNNKDYYKHYHYSGLQYNGPAKPKNIMQKYQNCVAFDMSGTMKFAPTTCINGQYFAEFNNIFAKNGDSCGNGAPAGCGSVMNYPPLPCLENPPRAGTPIRVVFHGTDYQFLTEAVHDGYCQCVPFSNSGINFAPWRIENGEYVIQYEEIFKNCNGVGYPSYEGFPANPPPPCLVLSNFGQVHGV